MGNWSKLKADEKIRVIKFARLNGVSDIKTIRDTYNLYTEGGQEEILNKVNSSNANFVQRLKDPNRKNIPDWESPTNRISTHKLSVGTDKNGNHYIFPEVQEINGELIDFTRPPYHKFAGEISAEMRGDTVRVPSIEDAIKFTETYKLYYPALNKKSTGGPLYPFSFEKNPLLKTPVVRYDEGGYLYGFGDWLKNIFKPSTDKQENTNNQNNLNYTSKVAEGEEIIWRNLPDTIILNNGINSGNVFDVARYAISGKKLDVPDTGFAWDLFSRGGFDNVYKVDKENKIFISLDPILYEKSVKPKLDYIGGSTEDTRLKTAYMINAYPIIQGIANKYNISPNLLFERFAHEGILDVFAKEYNYEYNAEKQRQIKKDPSIFWNTSYSAYNDMGLDTVLKYYINGDLKILDDSVNSFFELLTKTNNYTKILNEKGTESLDFYATPENMLHLQAAYFKFLKDKYQKDVEKGNYGNIDINTFLNAAYNLGQYHKDLKSTKWVTDNYSVKNWYNN